MGGAYESSSWPDQQREFKKLLNDRTDTDTLGYRLSLRLYRGEAGNAVRKVLDNPMNKAVLSGREEVEFNSYSKAIDTHNPFYREDLT